MPAMDNPVAEIKAELQSIVERCRADERAAREQLRGLALLAIFVAVSACWAAIGSIMRLGSVAE